MNMRMVKIMAVAFTGLCMVGCQFNNVDKADRLKTYFDSAGVQGCFCIYDNSRNEFALYNRAWYLQQLPPGGTFNVLTTLIGVQTGKIFDEHTVMSGVPMVQAFRGDSVGFFQELARSLGKDTINARVKAISYGNMDTTGAVDSLWLNGRLKISPDEQLGLVKKLFFNQLPFQQRTQQVVQGLMEREKNPAYTLAYSTGEARDSAGRPLGWVVGWVEERIHPYFFVLSIRPSGEGKNAEEVNIADKEIPLLKSLLTDQGFFKGVK